MPPIFTKSAYTATFIAKNVLAGSAGFVGGVSTGTFAAESFKTQFAAMERWKKS